MSRSVVPDPRPWRRLTAGALLALTACGGPARGGAPPGGGPAPAAGGGAAPGDAGARRGDLATQTDPLRVYQSMGLLANGLPIPVVASVQFLPGPTVDTAYAVVAMSIPSVSMTFVRDGDKYRGGYEVIVEARRGETAIARADAKETVRVASFRETQRSDESVVFQQVLAIPAGESVLAMQLRDAGSSRSVTLEKPVSVPRFDAGRPSAPIVALEAAGRAGRNQPPDLTASPRQTVQYGVDDVLPLYVELVDSTRADPRVQLAIRSADGTTVWRDSTTLARRGAALAANVVRVPLPQLGVGVLTTLAWTPAATDTARSAVLVSLGEDVPVASFDELVGYLRYYASAAVLRDLRATQPERRAQAWVNFLRATDPIASTPQHEGLRDYFRRIRFANERFREDAAAGWLSDRGAAYVAFGEPDQVLDQGGIANANIGQRGRVQAWDYVDLRIRLLFVDQNGFGRWRFTVQSAADFDAALRRKLNP
ncbi:MAG: GWxTD domain-containing protein [Gemmatimonadaceae bacterium]|nr:GWxTD domain-containing protein [Gemmatimonadaceae bacterium]